MRSRCFKLFITALITIEIAEILYQRRVYLAPSIENGSNE